MYYQIIASYHFAFSKSGRRNRTHKHKCAEFRVYGC